MGGLSLVAGAKSGKLVKRMGKRDGDDEIR